MSRYKILLFYNKKTKKKHIKIVTRTGNVCVTVNENVC